MVNQLTYNLLFPRSSEILSSIPIVCALSFRKNKDKKPDVTDFISEKFDAMVYCLNKDILETDLLISIGDSEIERCAILKIKQENLVKKILVVKTTENPSGIIYWKR